MKFVFRNLFTFFRNERIVFFLVILCSFASAVVLCFAYGLYYQYKTDKAVGETESKWISVQYADMLDAQLKADEELYKSRIFTGKRLTYKEFMSVIFSLPDPVWENHVGFYQLLLYDDSRGDLVIYPDTSMAVMDVVFIAPAGNLDRSTGMFTLSPKVEKFQAQPYNTVAGRGLTAEDVVYGRRVAKVGEDLFRRYTGSEKPYSEYETPPTIELFGESFEIIGIDNGGIMINVPITSIPEDAVIDGYIGLFVELQYDLPVTHNQYSLVKETVESAYPGILTVLELEFAQTDAVYYNTIIGISVFVAAIAALNFAILYQFVVMNRRKMIAVFGCCGCTRGRIARMFLGELLLLTLPLLAAGMLCYQYLLLPLLTERFVYIAGAFSLKLYVLIFVIFAAVTLLLVRIMLHRYISRLPVDCLKGGENV